MHLNKAKNLCLLLVALQLAGCGRSQMKSDLEEYIAKTKQRPPGYIEPLPEMKPYENFSYTASNLRSPFTRPDLEGGMRRPSNGLRPDMRRQKEILENFPLDALRMLGTLEKGGKRWALVKDSDSIIHRVSPGNYIGQNYGRVDSITEDSIHITEIVPDGRSGWVERKASLTLIAE